MFSADLLLQEDRTADLPRLIIDFTDVDKMLYLQTLDEGYTSEVTYTIRMNKKKGSFSSFFQQERITLTIKKKAVREYLTGMYIITSEGTEYAYQTPVDFFKAFFTCNTEIPPEYFNSDDYFIEVMAVADLIKRPKPLSLLEPFFSSEKTETGWVRLGN